MNKDDVKIERVFNPEYLALYIDKKIEERMSQTIEEILERINNPEKNHIIQIRGIYGLAKYLGCCNATAQKYKNMKGFPHHQVGRVIYYRSDLVDAWMDQHNISGKFKKNDSDGT